MENIRQKKMASLIRDRKRILDIGCSEIPNPYLKNPEVIGFDMLPCDNLPNNYTGFQRGDMENLLDIFVPGSFDAVSAGEIIEHFENPVNFLRTCYEILAPGGILVLSTPNPNSPFERILTIFLSRRFFYDNDQYRPKLDHVCLIPQRWIIRMMEIAGFKNVKLYSGGLSIPFLSGQIPFPRPWCYEYIASGLKI